MTQQCMNCQLVFSTNLLCLGLSLVSDVAIQGGLFSLYEQSVDVYCIHTYTLCICIPPPDQAPDGVCVVYVYPASESQF